MQHLGSIAACAALCSLPLAAQQKLDPSRVYPITTPVKNAGSVDVTTGRWTRGQQGTKAGTTVIFNNTCTWATQAYYHGFDWCEENYDEGRLPSPSDPHAPPGAQAAYALRSFQVSYCTHVGPLAVAGGYDMDVAFFDKLGGDCVGGVPPTPPPVSSTATAYFALAGLGLPGSTAFGFQACWVLTIDTSNTGVVLAADGEGTFDGTAADDKFLWMQRQNTTFGALQIPGKPDGFFISGEPSNGGFGACSYNIPCGINAFSGDTCGTGLDTFDGHWINVDGIGVGQSGQPAGCANTVAQYGFGTNCYFYGCYPACPFNSYWLVLEADGPRFVGESYCAQSKATSVSGCRADLWVTDASLATGVWSASDIPRAGGLATGDVFGIFLYTHGVGLGISSVATSVSFGTLCMSGFERSSPPCSPALLVGAQAGACNFGPMTTAVNCNGGALGIDVGEDVNVQLWYRDPGAVGNADFSNAVYYAVQ
jgi:hypothetical protein